MKLIRNQFLNLHFVFNMQVLLNLPDGVLLGPNMPNIGQVLDKSYKAQRPQMIREIAHDRKVFIAFQMWYLPMTQEQKELTMKNIKSSLSIDSFVPENILDREYVIEAINRIRAQEGVDLIEDAEIIED